MAAREVCPWHELRFVSDPFFFPRSMSLDVAESRAPRGSGEPKRGISILRDLWGAGFDPAEYPDCPEAAGVLLQSNRSTFKL